MLTPALLKKRYSAWLSLACLAACICTSQAQTSLLKEDWSAVAVGSGPDKSWRLQREQAGTLRVVDALPSPFGGPGSTLQIAPSDPAKQGPGLSRSWAQPVTGPLKITFDFSFSGRANFQPTFYLCDSKGVPGPFLTLVSNGLGAPGNNLINNLGGGKADVLLPVRAEIWYRVVIETEDAADGTYNVTVYAPPGAPVARGPLKFRAPLKDFGGIQFAPNAPHGEGVLNLANISVVTRP